MAKKPSLQIHVTGPARRDIAAIVKWSFREFGAAAALRYEALLKQAVRDIGADYERQLSRTRVSGPSVKEPRHFLLYRRRADGVIEVARILHDGRDLQRHLPERSMDTSVE